MTRRATTANWRSPGLLLNDMTHPNSPRRRAARSTGSGGAARASGPRHRGPSGRSDRPRTRADAARPADGGTSIGRLSGLRRGVPAVVRDRRPGLWRQAVVLGTVLIVVAIAVAGPIRDYLQRRDELARATQQQTQLEQQVTDLQSRKAALQDPNYVRAEARRRLQYVSPNETVYRIVAPPQTPAGDAPAAGPVAPGAAPWYGRLWDTLTEDVPPGG